ncbi:MAG: hypothetical protein K2K53_10750, partial [Oscillospiraceae bacterium]|nr:hypothetical protein [Oscillospiraceae bacterium]
PGPRAIPGENGEEPPVEEPPVYGDSYAGYALALAGYGLPEKELPPMPVWSDFHADNEDEEAWQQAEEAYDKALEEWRRARFAAQYRVEENETIDGFVTASTERFLAGAGEKNRVYSPLNVYMALAMLAETAGGDSRQQILDVLGVDSIETLREDAAALWESYYRDDDLGISVMANALWLRDGMTYSQDTLDTLAQTYRASSFAGEMGSPEYDQAKRDWVNEQTRNMLTEQADGLFFHPDTVLGLTSTLYFKSAWSTPFSPELNTRDVFHAPSGDVETEFMHTGEWSTGTYYWGDHFSAIGRGFQAQGYSMWFILPDEGYTVDDLLASGEAMEFLRIGNSHTYNRETDEIEYEWANQKYLRINLSLPKFDVSSDLELSAGLKALGITDVFDPSVSDFDPLGASTGDPLCISQVAHAARVTIDEEGCTAAAYTDLMLCGAAAPPDEEVDFTLDRPFLFAVTGTGDLPMFLGAVNQPNG